ncbi:MAG: homoserine O-succinyltransferase [Clostridiaceae bacterium]|nr:homoserine O-succinyltransferase [Clostridiaceae bacterium]
MPIKIADSLPARAVLESENIFVMTERRALSQDIRPLKIAILNLMPLKIVTETQILRCLSNTPLQIEIDLVQTRTYHSKNTPEDHLLTFYKTFQDIRDKKYDGFIITGAPVELMNFEEVEYWDELCEIMTWTRAHVHSTLHICWGAQAGLYFHYGIPKHVLPEKKSGVFYHRVLTPKEPIFRGFNDVFLVPHSRHTEVREADILANPSLRLLSRSEEAGVHVVEAMNGRQLFVLGHGEYDRDTLKAEYIRDRNKDMNPRIPEHYFPDDDPSREPLVRWRSHAHLFYTNWLNYYVYQSTPYVIESL